MAVSLITLHHLCFLRSIRLGMRVCGGSLGIFLIGPARACEMPSGRHGLDFDAHSRSRWATPSGVTSLMNASIADSDDARYFSLSALRRTDINSTWKYPSPCP